MNMENKLFEQNKVDGDLAVGRDVFIGGYVNIQNDMNIKGDLNVQGWTKAPNMISSYKGHFATKEDLISTISDPGDGWWAFGGTVLFVVDNGQWIAAAGNIPSDGISLAPLQSEIRANTNKIADCNKKIASAESKIENAQTAISKNTSDIADNNTIITGHTKLLSDLDAAVFPYSLSVSGGGVFEKGTTQTINISWEMKKGGSTVTPDSSKINGEPATGTYKQFTGVSTTTTYNVEATKSGTKKTGSTTALFVAASYYGVVSRNFVLSESGIKSLAKIVKNIKGHTISGQTLTNQKVCYAYPKSLGALTSIKDANNFDYINSYNRSELTINGEAYYVYILKDATSVSGFKQVFA